MDLDRASEATWDGPCTAWVLAHVAELAVAFAIMDRSGAAPGRQAVLALFATTLWFRTTRRASRFLGSGFSWRDAALASGATGAFQIGFALLGASSRAPLVPLDALAIVLYAGGASLSTLSDAVRRRFGAEPGNAGGLCTRGPFAYARHPKLLGDLLWASGWGIATHAALAGTLVAAHAAVLALVFIPALDRRLAARHGAAYADWAAKTARLVPFVY